MFIALGVAAILGVLLLMSRPANWNIHAALIWSLPLVALPWLTFWSYTHDAHWNKLFVIPVLLGATAFAWGKPGWCRYFSLAAIVGGMVGIAVSGWRWGTDDIDVFVIMQRGALSLLHGHNPYQLWFPSTTIGIHRFHYDYGPLLLLLSAPAAWLGDVRLLELLAAFGILALGAWRLRPTPERLPLLLLLAISPWLLWPVIQSWTELIAMALVLGWYGLSKRWRPSWLLLAVAVAVNPIVLLVVVPTGILFPELRRTALTGIVLGVLCYVMAYIVTGHDFIAAFQIASRQLYPATLGGGGLFRLLTGRPLPQSLTLIVFLGSCLVAYLRPPRSPAGRELAVAGIAALTVFCLPASYFEYVLIPMLWSWWWLGTAFLAVNHEKQSVPTVNATTVRATPSAWRPIGPTSSDPHSV
jgi:hypothetical protein